MDSRAERGRDRIVELAARQTDLATFWRGAAEVVATVVPHYWVPCWYTVDPESHLITSHFHEGLDEYPDEWLRAEYLDDDVNQLRDVITSEPGLTTLHDLTGGDPSGSPRWQANIQLGGDQELLLALRTRTGEAWGALGLYREPGSPMFDEDERRFLRSLSAPLAEGARRSLVFGEAVDPDWPDGPGLVVIGDDGGVVSMTGAGAIWAERLGAGSAGSVPIPLLDVARAARAGTPAEARVRVPGGPWVTVSAARLLDGAGVAVLVQPTRPPRIFDLLVAAHGLTVREREVVASVLAGSTTAETARELSVSPYTVQEHLKAVFDKMGVRSRRELVAQAFFHHYAPRFRDNEHRVEAGVPMRGNPAAGTAGAPLEDRSRGETCDRTRGV